MNIWRLSVHIMTVFMHLESVNTREISRPSVNSRKRGPCPVIYCCRSIQSQVPNNQISLKTQNVYRIMIFFSVRSAITITNLEPLRDSATSYWMAFT